jgi:hypothetical protein
MSDKSKSSDPHMVKGCLGLVALSAFSMIGAGALIYAVKWLFNF